MFRLLLALLLLCTQAKAVGLITGFSPSTSPFAANCPVYDTVEFTPGTAVVISDCVINVGPLQTVFVSMTGSVTCGPLSDIALLMIAAVNPGTPAIPLGASFFGQVSSGVLTVTSMVSPPSFTIQTGTTLFDANSGSGIPATGTNGSTVTITGQLTGTTGGVGTYSISNSSFSVGNEQMWALAVYAPAGKPPSTIIISHGPLEQTKCQDGTSQIITLVGSIAQASFTGTHNILIGALMSSENIGSNPSQSASLRNAQITMIALTNP